MKKVTPTHYSTHSLHVSCELRIVLVRVLRETQPFQMGNHQELVDAAKLIGALFTGPTKAQEAVECILKTIGAMKGVYSVEAFPQGLENGVIFYPKGA